MVSEENVWTQFSNLPGSAEERGSIYTVLAPPLTLSYVESGKN